MINKQMIEQIEEYAKENKIPIMQKDGILYLCNFIKTNNIKTILEIGSAIGYSSIMMATVDKEIHVTTIEKDQVRYNIALKNIKEFNLQDRITIINDDALNYKDNNHYDLIFIDASKGNNKNFFNMFENNLSSNGVIITDNLSFHGLVENKNLVKTKNQQGIVNKIKNFLIFLENNNQFNTTYVNVGDKIAISRRVSDE